MLDIKWIRDNAEALDAALAKRGAEPLSAALISLDEKRRSLVQSLQDHAVAPQCRFQGNRRCNGTEEQ